MTRSSSLIILAGLIALSPFSGLPQFWLAILMPAIALIVGIIGYSLRPRSAPPPVVAPESEAAPA